MCVVPSLTLGRNIRYRLVADSDGCKYLPLPALGQVGPKCLRLKIRHKCTTRNNCSFSTETFGGLINLLRVWLGLVTELFLYNLFTYVVTCWNQKLHILLGNQWHFLKHSEYTSSTMDSYNTELQVTRLYEPIRMLFRCQGWIPKTQLECNWNAVTFTHLMPPVISLMRTVDEMNPRLTIGSLAVARCLDSCSKTFA